MNLFAIVPAQHKAQAQLLLYVFYKMMDIHESRESILSISVSPTGENPPTHYIHCREVDDIFVEKQLIDQKRSNRSCPWAYTELTDDKDIALNNFTFMMLSKEKALSIVELQEINL